MDHRVVRRIVLLLALLGLFGPFSARAVTFPGTGQLSTTIGPVYIKTGWPSGGGDIAMEALGGFRAAFTPFNLGLSVGTALVMYGVSKGINQAEMYFQSGKNVTAPFGGDGWVNGDVPPGSSAVAQGYIYNGTVYTSKAAFAAAVCFSNTYNGVAYTASRTLEAYNRPNEFQCGCPDYCKANPQSPDIWWPTTGTFPGDGPATCAVGYALVNGQCIYDSTGAHGFPPWPSNAPQPYARQTGGSWGYHPGSIHYDGIDSFSTPASRTGTDTHGNPVRETLTPTSDGGVDYKRETQSEINGQPAVQTDKIHTDANGVVTSVTSNVAYNTSLTNVTQGGDTVVKIDTSDLNKEATQLQIKGGLDQINAKLDCANKTTLGCIELGEAGNKTELQTKDKADLFHEVSVGGGGGAGACPNDLVVSFLGFPYLVSYDLVCRYATGIHFVVVALAWVSAGWVMFGSWKGL